MKKYLLALALLFTPVVALAGGSADTNPTQIVNLDEVNVTSSDEENKISYIYYWGNGCPHCAKVAEFMTDVNLEDHYDITKKEIWYNRENATELSAVWQALGLQPNEIGVPFLLFKEDGKTKYLTWEVQIIDYFKKLPDFKEKTEKPVITKDKTSEADEELKEGMEQLKQSKGLLFAGLALLIALIALGVYFMTRKRK